MTTAFDKTHFNGKRTTKGSDDMQATFARILDDAQQSLETWITRSEEATMEHLPSRVFEAGRSVGLTDKEITQALVKRVRNELRPGLNKN